MRITCAFGHEWVAPEGITGATVVGQDECPICNAWKDQPRTADMRLRPTAASPILMPSPDEKPILPGFDLLRELGRGGMGVVYLARQLSLDRLVAVKMILDPGRAGHRERARFLTEVQAIAQLHHPNIVQVYESGQAEDRPYFTMEYISGGSLDAMLQQHTLGPRQAAELLEVLSRAMGYAHQAGVVHRDLKPANVLLQRVGQGRYGDTIATDSSAIQPLRTGELPLRAPERLAETKGSPWQTLVPKISDFGLARRLESAATPSADRLTASNMVVGTSGYMSPEQALGYSREAGPGTDIYSLGAVLYECLSGRPPFVATSWVETLHQVRFSDPIPLRYLRPGVPRDLEIICLKCLQKDPVRRYATAAHLADDLRRFLNGEAILARPTPLWERAGKWLKRRPLTASLTLTGVAATAAIVALGVWHLLTLQRLNGELEQAVVKAQQEEKRAQDAAANAERQKQTALAEKQNAQVMAKKARTAVTDYFKIVSQDKLLTQPGLKELRRTLLETARDDFERFVKAPETDTALRLQQAEIYGFLARVQRELGDHDKAIASYEQAKNVYSELLADDANQPGLALHRTTCDYDIGVIQQSLTRLDDAEVAYQTAYKKQRALVDGAHDNNFHNREALAATCNAIGLLAQERGDLGEAEIYHREALQLRKQLVTQSNHSFSNEIDLATSYNNIGLLHTTMGNYRAADESYLNAQRLLKQIAPTEGPLEYHVQSLVAVYTNRGLLLLATEQWQDAEADFTAALKESETLQRRHPNVGDYANDFARCHHNLGNLYRSTRRFAESRRHYELALQLRLELVAYNKDVALYQLELAGTRNNLAVVLMAVNQQAAAEKELEAAIAGLRELVAKDKVNRRYRVELADAWNNQGLLYMLKKQNDDADRVFGMALDKQRELAKEHSRQAEFQVAIGRTCFNRGNLWISAEKYETGIAWYKNAIEALKPVLEIHPRHSEARRCLRDAYTARAATLSLQHKDMLALQDWEEALKLEGGNRPYMRLLYGAALARCEKYTQAAKEIASGFAESTKDGEMCRLAAAGYALCALEFPNRNSAQFTVQAQLAVDHLERADKAGYFKDKNHVAKLKTDRDFQALEDFPPFRSLVKTLDARMK